MKNTDRRNFLKNSAKGTLTFGVALSALNSMAQTPAPPVPVAVSTPDDKEPVTSERLFRLGIVGPVELSRVTSEMAAEKATHKDAKMFAEFELTEAIAVMTVLKEMETPVPPMDAKATATLEKLKAAKGAVFDEAYITAQHENHVFLRDHAMAYLKNSVSAAGGKNDLMEKHGRHLATLALATFKEHVAITKKILGELKA